MVSSKEFFDKVEVEIFKIDTQNKSNFIMVDLKRDVIYRDMELTSIYDIIKDRHLEYLHWCFIANNFQTEEFTNTKLPDLLQFLYNNGKFDINKYSKLVSRERIIEVLLDKQKEIFKMFRYFVMKHKKNIYGLTFKPVEDSIIKEDGVNYFNIYRPKNSFKGLTARPNNEWLHIEVLLQNIFQEGYEHFLKFLAWKLQKPTELIPSHWIIQDDGGTGKTEILGDFILDRLFNVAIIGQDELQSGFTGYMVNSTLVICEEIEGYDNEKKVKMLTGAKFITINEKFKSTFKIRNYNNFIFNSNDIKSLKINDKDRRFNVVGGGKRLSPLSDGNWSNTLFGSKEENVKFFKEFHEKIEEELKNFYQYLMSLKVDRTEIQVSLNTDRKRDLAIVNYTSEIAFIQELSNIGLDNMINQYYSRNVDNFFKEDIINITISNSAYFGIWVRASSFYALYCDYSKKCNLRVIGKNHFFRRVQEVGEFNNLFEENRFISFEGKKFQGLKVKNNKNENNNV